MGISVGILPGSVGLHSRAVLGGLEVVQQLQQSKEEASVVAQRQAAGSGSFGSGPAPRARPRPAPPRDASTTLFVDDVDVLRHSVVFACVSKAI